MAIVYALLLFWMSEDWSQFRGPNSDGHVRNDSVPEKWSDTENVVWKVSIPGLGWSSPVIVDGRIYLTTAVPEGEGLSLRTLCLKSDDGSVIWDKEIRRVDKAPSIHTKNSHASPTPIVDGESLFVHFGALGTARLKKKDGELEWFSNELDYPPLHGSGGSPFLADGKLVVVCDGSVKPFVAALDASSGKVAWKTFRSVEARISHSFVTPIVAEVDGKKQVLAPGPDHFAAYDLETGKELWIVKAPGWSVVPQPTVAFGMVFYNHDYDNPELMAVKLGGQGDVTDTHVVWRMKRGAPSTPTPVLVGEDLFFVSDNGIASCVNAKTGERYWMERLGGDFSASPLHIEGKILFLDENGKATWVKAAREFEILGKNEVSGKTLATPGFDKKAMYLRTDEFLIKYAP